MRSKGRIQKHIEVLLCYVSEHPNEYQTYTTLSKATGIPRATLHGILTWERKNGDYNSLMRAKADILGFRYKIMLDLENNHLISVEKVNDQRDRYLMKTTCEEVAYSEDYGSFEYFGHY